MRVRLLIVIFLLATAGLYFFRISIMDYFFPYKADCFKLMEEITIESSKYSHLQKAYFYKAKNLKRPLIVSLHTWGGTYKQEDSIAYLAIKKDWNYIHPDYGGRQWTENSCCYEPAVLDIDDAISFAIKNGNVDTSKIILIGKSGGGTAVLASFLKSSYAHSFFYAWSPIPDQVSWYNEVKKDSILKERYLLKILKGTSSTDTLNLQQAKLKSPYHYNFTNLKIRGTKNLVIYVGVRDGLDGWSTSIKQPINFYNKLIRSQSEKDSIYVIPNADLTYLIKHRKPLRVTNKRIGGRELVYEKSYKNWTFTMFNGGHEILYSQVEKDLVSITKE